MPGDFEMHHRRVLLIVMAALMFAAPAVAQESRCRVEFSAPKPAPRDGTLATTYYEPTKSEKQLTKEWTEKELASNYRDIKSLEGFGGKCVSWFGIVREISEEKDGGDTQLLVEMKYFDRLTDTHLQIVSIFGAGDFRVVIPGVGHKIEKLSLVRVYGEVEPNPRVVPKLRADYVRVWNWGLFAFMNYGEDKSNPEWVKLRKVAPEDVYSSWPNDRYYKNASVSDNAANQTMHARGRSRWNRMADHWTATA
jgi:hypothetical protein